MFVENYDKWASVSTRLVLCGEGMGQKSSLQHCTHQVYKSVGKEGRRSEHSCLTLWQKAPSSWQGSEEGSEEGKTEGGASEQQQCEKRGEGKWG